MKILGTTQSPYVRKVRVCAHERGLDCPLEFADVWADRGGIYDVNPLGKIPCLVADGVLPLFDSRVIVEYLDEVGDAPRLIPQDFRDRIAARRVEALADGCLDAGILLRWEQVVRDASYRDPAWIARQSLKVASGIDALAAELEDREYFIGESFSLADVAAGVALGWFRFRFPELDWPQRHTALASYFERLSTRSSFVSTFPA